MSSDRLVATVLIEDRVRKDDTEVTSKARLASLESWLEYARYTGADTALVRTWEGAEELRHLDPTWARLAVHRKLLPLYGQSLVADCDILVDPAAGDVFSHMADGADFMALDQDGLANRPADVHSREVTRCVAIGLNVSRWPRMVDRGLRWRYLNTGVVVLRKSCAGLWDTVRQDVAKVTSIDYPEQTYTNYVLNTSGLVFYPLPIRFNYIPSEPFEGRGGKFAHHAGSGWKKETGVERYDQLLRDFVSLFGREPRTLEQMLPEFTHVL